MITWKQYEADPQEVECDLFGVCDPEYIEYEDPWEAVVYYIDSNLCEYVPKDFGELEIQGYRKDRPQLKDIPDVARKMIDQLSDGFQCEDLEEYIEVCPRIRAAELRFKGEILQFFRQKCRSYRCTEVLTITIPDLYTWCQEHYPEGIE